MNFKASKDRLSTIVTGVVTILFLYVIAGQLIPMYDQAPVQASVLMALLVGSYVYCYLQRPIGYSVSKDALTVHRPLKNWQLPFTDIRSARLLSPDEMKFTFRTFGAGGLFGYWGMFSNSRIGRFRMFATRRDRTVLIETLAGRKVVLTPDEPEIFVTVLKSVKGKNGHNFVHGHSAVTS